MLVSHLSTFKGSVSMPGTLTATTIVKPLQPEEEFCSTPVTTNLSPLAFYYGATDPCEKKGAYKALCSRLAHCVSSKMVR